MEFLAWINLEAFTLQGKKLKKMKQMQGEFLVRTQISEKNLILSPNFAPFHLGKGSETPPSPYCDPSFHIIWQTMKHILVLFSMF